MNKMTPMFLVLALIILGGLAFAGYSMRNRAGNILVLPSQTTSPSRGSMPTGAIVPKTTSSGYQSGISLTIHSPANGLKVVTSNVIVTGVTAPNSEVFVNDASGKANASGYFSISVLLDEGENSIFVMVNDADGNVAEQELTVTYEPR